MPMSIKIVELDFPWPSFTTDYVGWRSDFTVAGTANELHIDFPPCISTQIDYILKKNFLSNIIFTERSNIAKIVQYLNV